VGDEDHAARVLLEEVLEPGDALGVEVVGGLVEQQDVRLRQQEPRQRYAALLAARELGYVRLTRRAAQRVERLLDLGVEVPQAKRVDLVLERRHLIGGLLRVVGGDLVVAVEDGLLLRDAFHGVAEHVLLGIELRLLRQIADLDAVGGARFAEEVVDGAGHDLQERGLAGAVQAHDADLGARQERQRDVLQDLLAPRIGLGELVHVIDVLMGCGHWGRLSGRRIRDWSVF